MNAHLHNTSARDPKGLVAILVLTVIIMIAEVAGGLISNSLALLGDAGHMFTDLFSLGLSLFAIKMAQRPPTTTWTYGYHRMEVMAALTNGVLLIAISFVIFYEAYRRFMSPPEVHAPIMLTIASIALVANLISMLLLRGTLAGNINIRSAFLHIVGDMLSSLGVIVGGILILVKHWYFVDPIISILIGGIIIWGAIDIVFESSSILLEYVPSNIDPDIVNRVLLDIEGIKNVHNLHIWAITSDIFAMSSHIVIDDNTIGEGSLIIQEIGSAMRERFHISHTTIQIECENYECGMICNTVTTREKDFPLR